MYAHAIDADEESLGGIPESECGAGKRGGYGAGAGVDAEDFPREGVCCEDDVRVFGEGG